MERKTLRCFRRRDKGKIRHGVWVMTESTGLFIHGDRNEIQISRYNTATLEADSAFTEEISSEEALREIASYPDAVTKVQQCLDGHDLEDALPVQPHWSQTNQGIKWKEIKIAAAICNTAAELDELWRAADACCYGRSDLDRLDAIINARSEQIAKEQS